MSPSEQYDYMDLDDFEELLADMPGDQRWELIGGRVVKMMVGARWEHNFIIQNVAFGLRERFRAQGSPCRTFTETFYLKSRDLKSATLPDVIVRCGPLDKNATSLDDPKVLIEVVSPGSEGRDRVEMWKVYRRLTTLEHYVLIERDEASIDVFDRAGEAWASRRPIEGLDALLELPAANVSVPLAEIYRGRSLRVTVAPRAFVIGHPIAHSRSPLLHGYWLETLRLPGSYEKIDVAPEALPAFVAGLANAGFVGGNITVPHKTTMLDLVHDLADDARAIGAVNTVWFENGRLWGGNTDSIGFMSNLDDEAPGWDESAHRALVIGAGGAARAVVHGLLQRGLDVTIANRSPGAAEALSQAFARLPSPHGMDAVPGLLATADLVVNTTSLGMVGKPPLTLPLERLDPKATVCDIVYVPLETALLQDARHLGLRTVGGLGMLLHQAVPGFARWFGIAPTVSPALRALLEADVRGAV